MLENFVAENFIEFFVGAEQSRGKKGSGEKSLCVGGCCVWLGLLFLFVGFDAFVFRVNFCKD